MNELMIKRTAFANFVPTAAGTYTATDVSIPAGAVITGVRSVEGTALAGGTNVTFRIGTQALTAAIALAAFTGVDIHALTNADGLVATATGDLNIVTTGTFTAGDIDVYVDYFFAPDHT